MRKLGQDFINCPQDCTIYYTLVVLFSSSVITTDFQRPGIAASSTSTDASSHAAAAHAHAHAHACALHQTQSQPRLRAATRDAPPAVHVRATLSTEGDISMEVDENKSLEEPLSCSLEFPQSCSSDGNGNEIATDMVSMETDSDRLPVVASGDVCTKNSPEHLGNKELDFPVSNDAKSVNKMSSDAELSASNQLNEHNNEAMETVSTEEESIGNNPGKQPLATEADVPLERSNGSIGVASQLVHDESTNIAVDRTFAGYDGKKLLVLDVNGLLVDISSYVPYDYDPDDIIHKRAVFKRPHCDDFLKFCFERFHVGVWTSRTKTNVEPILDFLLGSDKSKLLFCWDQSQCTDTGFTTVEKRHKPLLLKKLKKLWNKCDPNLPWERGVFNESNTLLLDDTPYKALSNPRYTAVFPYSYRFKDVGDNSLGPGGDLRLYLEGLAGAENVLEYVKQNPFGQRAITEKNLSWGYYRKVIQASTTPPRETDKDGSGPQRV